MFKTEDIIDHAKSCNYPDRTVSGCNFVCLICDYRNRNRQKIKRHFLCHTGVKPFKCSYCEYETNRKDSLTRHLRTHGVTV